MNGLVFKLLYKAIKRSLHQWMCRSTK